MSKIKIIRISTVSISLNILLKGQLKFLSQFFNVVGISSQGLDLETVTQREGINTVAVNMERGISPMQDMVSLFKLYIQFKKQKPLIVHSITPKAGLLSMLAGKMAGVPIRMHTFTGLVFPTAKGLKQKILIKTDQLLCWAATNIYPEGNGVKNDLINHNITSKPLNVLANGNVNGINTDFYSIESTDTCRVAQLKKELMISEEDFVFIFVGRLVGDKGINEVVDAFSQLDKSANSKPCKLLLVGSLESDIDPLQQKTIKEIETNPNIINVGFQQDVRPYFAISNCLAFPSYREGFPNVVMQAGAMGLPSIVSNINGCNEIIVEGENGIIIPVKNSDSITQAMNKLMHDKDYYYKLKKNARVMIESRYEQQVVWNAVLREYKSLIAELKEV